MAAAMMSSAAHATVVTGVFTATATGGMDGPIGEESHDLTGDAVTGSFFYDTNVFTASNASTTGAFGNYLSGESPSAGSITWTVDGHTYSQNMVGVTYRFANGGSGQDLVEFQFGIIPLTQVGTITAGI
jgi:hypothetical protein